ncbi:MAG: tRNA pseudouridine(55) synthase TruB [Thermoguttaceae bacterium]|nr:tRNA pseudouridine(55) synthase TruB [Thermoguttaceae bacterium]
MYDGFLNIYKPAGVTSFDAVKMVLREILDGKKPEKKVKIGHAGTLDPLAEGVLVMALGRALKLISRVQEQKKTYVGTFRLGFSSPSEDVETEMTPVPAGTPAPTLAQIEAVLPEFLGEIMQKPPIYSALKVNGRKAYDLARKGKEVELKARPIRIYALEVLNYDFPQLTLKIVCGSGTYVRSLGRDLARRLGTEAVMSALIRTAIGNFRAEDALEIRKRDDPRPLNRPHCTELIRPFFEAVPDLPRITYDSQDVRRLRTGIAVIHPAAKGMNPGDEAVVLNEAGDFLGIVRKTESGTLRSVLNFANEMNGADFPKEK